MVEDSKATWPLGGPSKIFLVLVVVCFLFCVCVLSVCLFVLETGFLCITAQAVLSELTL